MTTRGAAIQGTLAAVGLVAAYATWQKEPERPPGEVVVLDFTRGELGKVRYEDAGKDGKDAKWVELEPRPDPDGEAAVWMRVSARPEAKAPERELRGNDSALKLFEKFAPLRATRALGKLGADKLKELGLEAPKKKVLVTARGSTYTLLIGTSPYGVSEPYVKDERDGKVYVLSGSVVSDLDAASVRLVDRALHAFKQTEYDALTITAGGKQRAVVQTGATPAAIKLAPKAAPDKPDDTLKNWHDKVWRLAVLDSLGKGENPPAGAPTVALRVDYAAKGKPRGWIELGRVTPAPANANTSAAPPPVEVWARSERTASWVKLPMGTDEVVKEGEQLAAKE